MIKSTKILPMSLLGCEISDQRSDELAADGWEMFYSFKNTDSAAAQKVSAINRDDWDVLLVDDHSRAGKKKGGQFIYIKKTISRDKWDRGKGY